MWKQIAIVFVLAGSGTGLWLATNQEGDSTQTENQQRTTEKGIVVNLAAEKEAVDVSRLVEKALLATARTPASEIKSNEAKNAEDTGKATSTPAKVGGLTFPDLGNGSPFDGLNTEETELFTRLYLEYTQISMDLESQYQNGEIEMEEFREQMEERSGALVDEMEAAIGKERYALLNENISKYTAALATAGDVLDQDELKNSELIQATVEMNRASE